MNNLRVKFFWLLDVLLMLVAFLATGWWVAPLVHDSLLNGGALSPEWAHMLSAAESRGGFSPLGQFFWVLALVAPATILCVNLLGGHGPIAQQTPTRIFAATAVAPILGVSILSTLFYVLRTPGYSRVFVASFAVTSAFLMCAVRWVGR